MNAKSNLILTPLIFEFSDSAHFFAEFIRINKSKSNPVSGRQISRKLNWPFSLIVDIIKKRKPLTPQRAGEFARFFEMNSMEFERLISISLMETGDHQTSLFYKKKLTSDPAQVLSLPVMSIGKELYYYVDVIVGLLLLENQPLTAAAIKKKLNHRSLSLEKIKKALGVISKNKILSWDSEHCHYRQLKNYSYDNHNKRDSKPFEGIDIHKDYAKNFLEFIENPQLPSAYISGCATITKEQFMPIALQLFQIKNWLVHLSTENRNVKEKTCELRLMQFDLNFFKTTK